MSTEAAFFDTKQLMEMTDEKLYALERNIKGKIEAQRRKGHGLGLEIHTEPRMSQLSTQTLETNNVVTIEPGIYLEGWGGVRIEDDVIIHEEGCEVLNKTTKELVVLT